MSENHYFLEEVENTKNISFKSALLGYGGQAEYLWA